MGEDTSDLAYIIPWTAFEAIFGYLVPIAIIVFSYVHLFRRLRHLSAVARGGHSAGAGHQLQNHAVAAAAAVPEDNDVSADASTGGRVGPSPAAAAASSRRGRMARTVSVATLTYVVLQLPNFVTQAISVQQAAVLMTSGEVVYSAAGLHAFVWGSAFAQILIHVSSCCNPIIYGITNDNFSK